jgi:hypothetical protein
MLLAVLLFMVADGLVDGLVDDCAGVAGEAGAGLFKVETVGAVADGTGVKERDAAVCLDH